MSENKQQIPGGLVVMFEGIDGTGKTTQVQLVQQHLQQNDWPVSVKRSPGGTPIGEALRTALLDPAARPPLTDLYIALAIQEALIESIDSERAVGPVILLDRSPLSIAAYQVYGSGIDEAMGWGYVDDHMQRLKPDLVIIYECDASDALKRARQKSNSHDYFENMPLSYFERVAKGYRAAADRYPSVIIDASQSIEQVNAQTMQHISKLLQDKG